MNTEVDYKSHYMQNPFDTLTKEKLDRLEKHCKKAIHFERGNIQEEHQTVLDLLYKYKEQQAELEKKDKVINEMAKHIQENEFYDDIICMEKNCKNEECHGECGEDCIKEHFTNKVEREGK